MPLPQAEGTLPQLRPFLVTVTGVCCYCGESSPAERLAECGECGEPICPACPPDHSPEQSCPSCLDIERQYRARHLHLAD